MMTKNVASQNNLALVSSMLQIEKIQRSVEEVDDAVKLGTIKETTVNCSFLAKGT